VAWVAVRAAGVAGDVKRAAADAIQAMQGSSQGTGKNRTLKI
jgi:hypothetical protein